MSHVQTHIDEAFQEMTEERIAILIYDGGLGEKEAELKAYRETMAPPSAGTRGYYATICSTNPNPFGATGEAMEIKTMITPK